MRGPRWYSTCWRACRITRDRHQSSHTLRNLVKSRALRERTRLSKTRNAGVHQAWVCDFEGFVINPESELHIWAEVLDHHVSFCDQLFEYRNSFGFFQIKGNRALVAVRVLVVRTVLTAQRIVAAHMFGHLNLNHICAPIGELAATGWTCSDLGEIDNAKACKSSGGGHV